jgi:hypothetical protein
MEQWRGMPVTLLIFKFICKLQPLLQKLKGYSRLLGKVALLACVKR